ncbi:uncharacterized protein [Physcomitrium patens]|nr:uncharacterized protein LOC112276033 [Physcomitrium patens]|eukprot:XP_024362744.1 uncharacterized protein LOC112276033 [Physcomitrella patens]
MKEKFARVVLRGLRLQGRDYVELRRDGATAVFYCSLCGTRCYNDAALSDHLNGKAHARHEKSAHATVGARPKQVKRALVDVDGKNESLLTTAAKTREECGAGQTSSLSGEVLSLRGGCQSHDVFTKSSTTSLKWIGSGELFLRIKSMGNPFVEATWFSWQNMCKSAEKSWNENTNAAKKEYAVVVFPYSEGIGRGCDWLSASRSETKGSLAPENRKLRHGCKLSRRVPGVHGPRTQDFQETAGSKETSPPTPRHTAHAPSTLSIGTKLTESVSEELLESNGEPSENGFEHDGYVTTFRRIWKRKQAKNSDRMCFICHQRLLPIQGVAALVNVQSGQMICGSRNRQGVFHVFHSACLVEWIAFCEAKTWNASLSMSRKLKRHKVVHPNTCQEDHANDTHDWPGTETEFTSETGIFCPECQGTGVKMHGPQLEHPRFRLYQVYEWVMELIESRKAYIEGYGNPLGLLFVKKDQSKSPGVVQSQGFVHFYSAGGPRDLVANLMDRDVEACK